MPLTVEIRKKKKTVFKSMTCSDSMQSITFKWHIIYIIIFKMFIAFYIKSQSCDTIIIDAGSLLNTFFPKLNSHVSRF